MIAPRGLPSPPGPSRCLGCIWCSSSSCFGVSVFGVLALGFSLGFRALPRAVSGATQDYFYFVECAPSGHPAPWCAEVPFDFEGPVTYDDHGRRRPVPGQECVGLRPHLGRTELYAESL